MDKKFHDKYAEKSSKTQIINRPEIYLKLRYIFACIDSAAQRMVFYKRKCKSGKSPARLSLETGGPSRLLFVIG